MARNLLTSLMMEKRIITTEGKAKYIKPIADKVLRSAVDANDATKRRLAAIFTNNTATKELFGNIVPKLPKSTGSYIRIIKINSRAGDQADQAAVVIMKAKEDKPVEKVKTSKEKSSVR